MKSHRSTSYKYGKKSGRRGAKSRASRDRILLYLSGLGVDGLTSLELTAECIRRSSPDPTHEEAMRILSDLLREKGTVFQAVGFLPLLHSSPPLNRRSMVSEKMAYSPIVTAVVGLIPRCLGLGRTRAKNGRN